LDGITQNSTPKKRRDRRREGRMSWLANHDVQFEPFASDRDWPGKLRNGQGSSPFRSTALATLQLLDRELTHLKARAVVLQTFHGRDRIRVDGMPRADARPARPGVVLRFESQGRRSRSHAIGSMLGWKTCGPSPWLLRLCGRLTATA
jgi:hypothetical protein